MRAAYRTRPMGPLELEATVLKAHSRATPWRSEARPTVPLQPRPLAEADLRWFHNEAAGELGLRAMSLEPTAGRGDGVQAAERQTAAYVRYTAVRAALLTLPADDRRVLSLAFTERHYHEPLTGWHERAGVAAWLLARQEQACHGRTISPDDALALLAEMASDRGRAVEAGLLRSRAERRMREGLDRYRAAQGARL